MPFPGWMAFHPLLLEYKGYGIRNRNPKSFDGLRKGSFGSNPGSPKEATKVALLLVSVWRSDS